MGGASGTRWALDDFQQEVEQAMLDGGGLANLLKAFREWVRAMLAPKAAKSMLVNAAVSYGLNNGKKRRPVVVQI